MVRKILALLLIFCLVAGMLPTMAMAAEVPLSLNSNTLNDPTKWDDFKQKISSAQQGDVVTVTVAGEVHLPEPLGNQNGATFNIIGENNASIVADIDYKENFKDTHLFSFSGGTDSSKVVIQNLTLDGNGFTGAVCVSDYGRVQIGSEDGITLPDGKYSVTVQNCYTGLRNGGGIKLLGVSRATVRDCHLRQGDGSSVLTKSEKSAEKKTGGRFFCPKRQVNSKVTLGTVPLSHFSAHIGGGSLVNGARGAVPAFLQTKGKSGVEKASKLC